MHIEDSISMYKSLRDIYVFMVENLLVFVCYSTADISWCKEHIDGLMQDCGNFIANALELPKSCAEPCSVLPSSLV